METKQPELIFVRTTTDRERHSPTAKRQGFNSFPDLDEYDKVYMPYGSNGPGYYYKLLPLSWDLKRN